MVMLTPREALAIQAKQLDYYGARFPHLREAARRATNLEGLEMDREYKSWELSKKIPRGCDLGYLIGEKF